MKTIFTIIFSMMIIVGYGQNFNWTAQNSTTSEWLNDLHFVDNLTGWAIGNNGTIVATVDGGETWTTQASGTDRKLRSVYFLDQDTGWVAGGESPLIVLYTVNGGTDWETLATVIENAAFLEEIQFASSTFGFGIAGSNIYSTEDGGTTWERGVYNSSIKSVGSLHDIHILSDSSALACGKYTRTNNNARPGVFDNLINSAGEWTPQGADEFDTDDRLRAIYVTESGKGFAGGEKGKLYSMVASGNTFPGIWELNFTVPSGGWIHSIDFAGNDYGVFNSSIEVNSVTIQLIYHSGNGGDNWAAPDSIPGLLLATLSVGDEQNVWIAGSAGQIFKGTPKSTGVAEGLESIRLTVIPNPFTSSIQIESAAASGQVQLELFNNAGQLVKSAYVRDFQNSYELEGLDHLDGGVYILRMKSFNGNLNSTLKLVKY